MTEKTDPFKSSIVGCELKCKEHDEKCFYDQGCKGPHRCIACLSRFFGTISQGTTLKGNVI